MDDPNTATGQPARRANGAHLSKAAANLVPSAASTPRGAPEPDAAHRALSVVSEAVEPNAAPFKMRGGRLPDAHLLDDYRFNPRQLTILELYDK